VVPTISWPLKYLPTYCKDFIVLQSVLQGVSFTTVLEHCKLSRDIPESASFLLKKAVMLDAAKKDKSCTARDTSFL
jgi:hypothetical protein